MQGRFKGITAPLWKQSASRCPLLARRIGAPPYNVLPGGHQSELESSAPPMETLSTDEMRCENPTFWPVLCAIQAWSPFQETVSQPVADGAAAKIHPMSWAQQGPARCLSFPCCDFTEAWPPLLAPAPPWCSSSQAMVCSGGGGRSFWCGRVGGSGFFLLLQQAQRRWFLGFSRSSCEQVHYAQAAHLDQVAREALTHVEIKPHAQADTQQLDVPAQGGDGKGRQGLCTWAVMRVIVRCLG